MIHEVLYQERAAWLVGESKEEAVVRRQDARLSSVPDEQWPNDYAGRVVSIRRKGKGPSLRNMAGDLFRVVELELTAEALESLRNRQQKIGLGGLDSVTFDDRWGAVAKTLRANLDDPEAAEIESMAERDGGGVDARRFAELSALAKTMLPKTVTRTGTGLYSTKAVPTKVDDTQDGAPAGQVITLTTGGLGVADAFKGGYVKNTGILSGTDDQPTATGPSAPAGHSWAASVSTGSAWVAADDNAATSWLAAWTGPEWWEYTAPTSKTYGKVSIQAKTVIVAGRLPQDFKAQGWDGGSWIDLLTVTGETGWIAAEKRSWEFTSNIAAYSKYRLYITANNGDGFIEIAEVEWFATTEELRAIVSHTDDTVTLEGSLTNWTDTDTLEVYDAWSTIQMALDQLWADQGATLFTARQIVRVFAGTYDETPTPNTSLNPDEALGYVCIIEGDPSDSRDNVIVAPTSGSPVYSMLLDFDQVLVRHLTVSGTPSTAGIFADAASTMVQCDDCVIDVPVTGIRARNSAATRDCDISVSSDRAIFATFGDVRVIGCAFTGTGGAKQGILAGRNIRVEASTITGFESGIYAQWSGATTALQGIGVTVLNSTFYNCSVEAIRTQRLSALFLDVNIINVIAQTVGRVFTCVGAAPQETAIRFGSRWTVRNCAFYDYTTFANAEGDRTYAEFAAFNRVDADGDLDQVNPLLTDPGAGDFSLQDASPCINTGHGSGVTSGYLGTDFDPNHPDIGAWSSGAAAAHLTPVLDSWANVGDGETVTLTVSNVEGSRTVHAFYRLSGSMAAFTESPTTRTGPGDVNVGSLEEGSTYEGYVITSDGVSSDMPSLPSNLLTFTPSLVTAGDAIALEGQGLLDLQLTDDCSDLEVVNLDLAIVDGTVQIKQALCIALRLFMGEWFLDGNAGVPYYQNVLVKNPDLSGINSILKAEILKVVNVNKILEFSSSQDSATRRLSVSFRVDTVFGPVTVEETL